MPSIEEARPPYVKFERRAIEDRNKSIAQGHFCTKDVDFVRITPAGSKDTVERPVDEWFADTRQRVQEGRFPDRWFDAYERAYDKWKKGEDMDVDGTAIKTWPVVSPSQINDLIAINILTVEDLANANAEAVQRIGMGGQLLKQRAQDWLKSVSGPGKLAEEISALKAKVQNLETSLRASEERNKSLVTEVTQLRANAGDPGAKTMVKS